MYDLQYGVNVQHFTKSINPLQQIQTLKTLHHPDMLKSCGIAPSQLHGTATQNFISMLIRPSTKPIFNNKIFQSSATSTLNNKNDHDIILQAQNSSSTPILIDTGASCSITPNLQDFVGDLKPAETTEVKGLSGSTQVVGKGMVEWSISDYWNVTRTIRTTAYYIPAASARLFSPQAYFQENQNNGKCVIEGHKISLELPS